MNTKTIIRGPHNKDNPYFMCRRDTAQNRELSWEARGMLWYLLSRPDDWEVKPADLEQQCSRGRVYRILAELRDAGHLRQEQPQDTKGQFSSSIYRVYEVPCEKPHDQNENTDNQPCDDICHADLSEQPCDEKPYTENRHPTKYRIDKSQNPQKTIAAPPDGGQRPVDDTPDRDLIFEVIVQRGFGIDLDNKAGVAAVRAKANWIASWAKGNPVKINSRDTKKSLPGCSPPASANELEQFYDWWQREKGIDKPQTAAGIAQFMAVFRNGGSQNARRTHSSRVGQPAPNTGGTAPGGTGSTRLYTPEEAAEIKRRLRQNGRWGAPAPRPETAGDDAAASPSG